MGHQPAWVSLLRPGDVLLYRHRGVRAWVIRHATWSDVSHCEVYLGDGLCATARGEQGTGIYDLETRNMRHLLRPIKPFDVDAAMRWHWALGWKPLGWVRLAWMFFKPDTTFRREEMHCVEYTIEMLKAGGAIAVTRPDFDPMRATPLTLFASPAFRLMWSAR